ncbi:MAG: hypothetical protein ACTSQJ_13765 [Promethearchaeota archaeon]
MFFELILIIISICISTAGIVYTIINRKRFGNILYSVLNILIFLILGVFFFICFNLSTIGIFSDTTSYLLWNISIVSWIVAISIFTLIHSYIIENKRILSVSLFFYSFLSGIIIGIMHIQNTNKLIRFKDFIVFNFQNSYIIIIILIFNFWVICEMIYKQIVNSSAIHDKRSNKLLTLLISYFLLIVFVYSIYLIFQNIILKDIFSIIYIIGALYILYIVIKKSNLFFELTSQIFNFVIFHKSGILLYTYNFETNEETEENILKGTILIGINHILSQFINKKDQLNLIKMKNKDIILEFVNEYGYAVLLIMKNKNTSILRAVHKFIEKFNEIFKENLEKINNFRQIVDISEFQNSREILFSIFEPFISKN